MPNALPRATEWGMAVRVRFATFPERLYRNVTEIHYRYPPHGTRVAFESDVHGTGATWELSEALEFEVRQETEEAAEF